MKSFKYTIKDEVGIHARPAGTIAKEAKEFSSKINIEKGERTADLTKLMAVMGLGIKKGDNVTITASGDDEDKAIEKMKEIFEKTV